MTRQKAERLAYHMMKGNRFEGIDEARRYMVERWNAHDAAIPGWGERATVELDLAYTTPETAKACVADLIRTVPDGHTYFEPSAGTGAFMHTLPDTTITMDVLPRHHSITQGEFLTWEPPGNGPYCVVGAPPFGERLWLPNAFTVRALDFAGWVGFITDTKAMREMPNGTLHHTMPLGSDAMRGLSGGRVRRALEWRVGSSTEGPV